jgi:leader peptidase (prepilin peptidase)/N-methyltransferase
MGILRTAFFIVLLTASYQDIKKMEIKDGCHAAIVLLAAAAMLLDRNTGTASRLLGALCVSAPMLALSLLIPGAFGGGDIKLMAAAGLFLGWKSTVISAVLAVFAAGAYGLYIRMIKKAGRGQCFPFGPFLCAGMAAAVLWGKELWEFWLKL